MNAVWFCWTFSRTTQALAALGTASTTQRNLCARSERAAAAHYGAADSAARTVPVSPQFSGYLFHAQRRSAIVNRLFPLMVLLQRWSPLLAAADGFGILRQNGLTLPADVRQQTARRAGGDFLIAVRISPPAGWAALCRISPSGRLWAGFDRYKVRSNGSATWLGSSALPVPVVAVFRCYPW